MCCAQSSWTGGFGWSLKMFAIFVVVVLFIIKSQVEQRENEIIERKDVGEGNRT